MNQLRKKFDKEFKKKAVELSYTRGSATEIAEELGIERALLYRWRKEFKQYDKNSFPGHGTPKMTDLERENVRLQLKLSLNVQAPPISQSNNSTNCIF